MLPSRRSPSATQVAANATGRTSRRGRGLARRPGNSWLRATQRNPTVVGRVGLESSPTGEDQPRPPPENHHHTKAALQPRETKEQFAKRTADGPPPSGTPLRPDTDQQSSSPRATRGARELQTDLPLAGPRGPGRTRTFSARRRLPRTSTRQPPRNESREAETNYPSQHEVEAEQDSTEVEISCCDVGPAGLEPAAKRL